jgi:hypothetical protein
MMREATIVITKEVLWCSVSASYLLMDTTLSLSRKFNYLRKEATPYISEAKLMPKMCSLKFLVPLMAKF